MSPPSDKISAMLHGSASRLIVLILITALSSATAQFNNSSRPPVTADEGVRKAEYTGDIEAQDWLGNIYMRLPEYIPEVQAFLAQLYAADREGNAQPESSPGSGLIGNLQPPKYEVHLVNASVLDILDAIAVRSREIAESSAEVGQPPKFPMVGWKAKLPPIRNLGPGAWMQRVFSAMPQ